MFPLDSKEPYIKENGSRSTLGEMFGEAGADVAEVKAALDDEIKTRAALGAHNLLQYSLNTLKTNNTSGTWENNVYTLNNLTFTVNEDLSVKVNGTASAVTTFYFTPISSANLKFGADVILSGYDGYGWNDMYLQASGTVNYTTALGEVTIPLTETISYIRIRTNSGQVLSNAIVKPMVRLATDSDSTYQPYAMTNQELTDKVTPTKGTFSWNGATFSYCQNDTFMTITSNDKFTTEPTEDSDWSMITTLNNPYGGALYGTFMINKGSVYKLRFLTTGELGYVRIVNGAGVGLFIQDTCVLSR